MEEDIDYIPYPKMQELSEYKVNQEADLISLDSFTELLNIQQEQLLQAFY